MHFWFSLYLFPLFVCVTLQANERLMQAFGKKRTGFTSHLNCNPETDSSKIRTLPCDQSENMARQNENRFDGVVGYAHHRCTTTVNSFGSGRKAPWDRHIFHLNQPSVFPKGSEVFG
jgi:hypothetical protein